MRSEIGRQMVAARLTTDIYKRAKDAAPFVGETVSEFLDKALDERLRRLAKEGRLSAAANSFESKEIARLSAAADNMVTQQQATDDDEVLRLAKQANEMEGR